MGDQPLEELTMTASVDGVVSDRATTSFGIREVSAEYMPNGARRFLINGTPILIRGGGWASDMLLQPVPGRVDDQLMYVRDMGLNTVRLEGKLESDHFFDEADRLGILVMPGWMCCDYWQESWKWTDDVKAIARASMTSQADPDAQPPERLHVHDRQRHEAGPGRPADVREGAAGRALAEPDPGVLDRRHVVRARTDRGEDDRPVRLGPAGLLVRPARRRRRRGLQHGDERRTVDPRDREPARMLSRDELRALWTEPRTPQYHAGVGDSVFKTFHIFDRAMTARMGAPTSLADYVRKAQVMAYENERAMFESFSRNKYAATGLIQWMLNNAWPSLHWNLFDWYLEPNGSTFGAKIANEPLHVQYSYDDRSVAVVNQTLEAASGLTAEARVFDLGGDERWHRSAAVDVAADGVAHLFHVPQPANITSTYFVELTLSDASGDVVSRNVYWLSTAAERLAWRASTWFFTPTKTYADFTALADLPTTRPTVSACADAADGTGTIRVAVTNDGDDVAFFVRVRLTAGPHGHDVTPVTWSDGYVTLMPGEERTLTASYRTADLHGAEPSVDVSGWNVPASRPAIEACA